MFDGCNKFNQPVNFDTSKVTDMTSMFRNCYVFNQPVSSFSTSSVTSFRYMFENCYAFNQPVDNFITTRSDSFERMFANCGMFKQSLASWDVNKGNYYLDILVGADMNEEGTTTNYDDTLVSWGSNRKTNKGRMNMGSSRYSSRGATGRSELTSGRLG